MVIPERNGMMKMFSFLNDVDNYEDRLVSRDVSNSGITVSTCDTTDEGFETALIDANTTSPVERYKSRKAAEAGHKKWLKFAHTADGKKITVLGAWGLTPEEKVVLKA